jgi:hypothetical protein
VNEARKVMLEHVQKVDNIVSHVIDVNIFFIFVEKIVSETIEHMQEIVLVLESISNDLHNRFVN